MRVEKVDPAHPKFKRKFHPSSPLERLVRNPSSSRNEARLFSSIDVVIVYCCGSLRLWRLCGSRSVHADARSAADRSAIRQSMEILALACFRR
ncbi:hypothetical protein IscW_ISCW000643 [Ixodes scapularis]|uniref:Uncharacterized protein n=1 Tax=Ixodes scapularis TaxID=6945 RepID=B7P1P0_IXOSC|nr:hypothetical protein IscW_ISCW000643 [Ixodes scapularis]|eukprot:XP_002433448.1 hypothetical protein IscW_ISCW000643 [Ixodes scapularis]